MIKTQEELIKEEQKILNNLIREMDDTLLRIDRRLTLKGLQAKKAKSSCLPDAYGMLVSAEHEKLEMRHQKRELYKAKDELYERRIEVDVTDEQGNESKEIKIGLHTYLYKDRIFITSWVMPLCRHFMLDNAAEEYVGIVTGKHGEKYKTHYQLKLKRQVNIFFDKVKSVTHYFPELEEEVESVIADEFLQELLERRSEQDFKNIVFSIQKKQGEIIQTPFKQNLIVQGCAGSGKSMIMLHRLPILLYDNPNSLGRNNLYIITPSITYIQMAENMRMELEIEDLKMGTLEQYYDHVLEKYGLKPEIYGTIKPYIKLSQEDLEYVYSSKCVKDIRGRIEEIIEAGAVDYRTAYISLNIKEQIIGREAVTPADRIRREAVNIQAAINQNEISLRSYHHDILNMLTKLDEFARWLESRKSDVIRGIARQISMETETIAIKRKELSEIHNREQHEIMYQNRVDAIKKARNNIIEFQEIKERLAFNEDYFEELKEKARQIRQILGFFAFVKNERSEMSLSEQYQAIAYRDLLCDESRKVIQKVSLLEDPYRRCTDSIASGCKMLETELIRLSGNHSLYLSQDRMQKLMDANKYYTVAATDTVEKIYRSLMKRLGQEPDEKDRLDALECSPYLYLQIMYQFSGVPKAQRESLITIDEAQNVAPEELRLIKAVNGNRVVLNLFGDVKQHIEGSKGIDDWKMISDIAYFKKEHMQENYRNARQITAYCNKRFKLNMRKINLDGTGVHELKSDSEFTNAFIGIFQKPQNVGLSCIIVKNKQEADTLLDKAGIYTHRIHNMTEKQVELRRNKWNLMTVEQAKGLEFETVFAVSGRMSENEKYITYTRALDELYVYDIGIELIETPEEETSTEKKQEIPKEVGTRKKRKKRTSKETKELQTDKGLREFFEEKGLEVIDDRKKSGHLWVIGSQEELDPIVSEASEIYGATGKYGSGKRSRFKYGWYTKSKK